ncbi:MAG: hypothetical protein J6U36_05995, partial [Oscillospiraceae bacterium]|nr:hypothetical protein [Oscillospiraceae bacterium]
MKQNSLFKSVYKDASIEVKNNDVVYKYYYKASMNDEQIAQAKKSIEGSGLDKQIDSLKDSFKKSCGIRPDRIAFEYYTADGVSIATVEG